VALVGRVRERKCCAVSPAQIESAPTWIDPSPASLSARTNRWATILRALEATAPGSRLVRSGDSVPYRADRGGDRQPRGRCSQSSTRSRPIASSAHRGSRACRSRRSSRCGRRVVRRRAVPREGTVVTMAGEPALRRDARPFQGGPATFTRGRSRPPRSSMEWRKG